MESNMYLILKKDIGDPVNWISVLPFVGSMFPIRFYSWIDAIYLYLDLLKITSGLLCSGYFTSLLYFTFASLWHEQHE